MDVDRIYKVAKEAQKTWGELAMRERLVHFRSFRRALADRSKELCDVLHNLTRKPHFEALTAEIFTVVDTIAYWEKYACRQLRSERVRTPLFLFGRRSWLEYRPKGVVLVISPWNFPLQLTLIPVLSAVLAGNAVILKPSEVTGGLDHYLRKLFHAAGFPEGLIQVVSGAGAVGASLVEGQPDLIFFTGSLKTGLAIQKAAAKNLIPTILELGGKDSMILLDDAPLERAVQGALWGSFNNSGQVCLGTERIFVHKSIYKPFLERFARAAQELVLGELASPGQVAVVRSQIEDALSKGASLVAGDPPTMWKGDKPLIPPTILTDLRADMVLVTEETFGPVVTVLPFSSEDEAIRLANSGQYGLGASVWSRDLDRAKKVASQLAAGGISINDTMITVANPHLPFGGLKGSGLGFYRGGKGLQVFCNQVAVMTSRGTKKSELNWFPYTKEKHELLEELILTRYGTRPNWLRLARKALNPKVWF